MHLYNHTNIIESYSAFFCIQEFNVNLFVMLNLIFKIIIFNYDDDDDDDQSNKQIGFI